MLSKQRDRLHGFKIGRCIQVMFRYRYPTLVVLIELDVSTVQASVTRCCAVCEAVYEIDILK